MTHASTRLLLGLSAAVALGLAACSDSSGPANAAVTPAEADELALSVVADLDALPAGASYDAMGGIGFSPSPSGRPPDCVTREPNPPANSDTDPVPDSVRLTFDCSFTTLRGVFTLTGMMDILDMFPTDSGHSIRSVFIDLTHTMPAMRGEGSVTTVENGTRTAVRSADQLAHALIDFQTDLTFPDGSTASHVRDWSAAFTADVPGSIEPRQPLPSGTFDVDGTSVWTRGDRSWSLSVTTDPDLHYNATCEVRPRFDAGIVTTHVTRGDRESTVTIEFTACGQYIVTRS